MPDGAFLAIEGVAKSFAGVPAVDGVSLQIGRGEVFALLGPSGCGKTTLLRMIAGFETPDRGRIVLDGEDITGLPPYRRPVNMMFQSYALFPHLSVAGNIAFGLKQEKFGQSEIRSRVAEMVTLVRLDGLEDRKPHQLSGGQRQRVALARALAKRPKLVLLDEPLAALDRKLRGETQFELLAIQRRLGLTFVIVTHDQDEAMTLAQRLAVMDRGQVVQVGSPRQVYDRPISKFVAGFIGTANFFDGQVVARDGRTIRLRCLGFRAEIHVAAAWPGHAAEHAAGHDAGHAAAAVAGPGVASNVTVAVRPEKLHLVGSGEGCCAARVEELAFRGEATLLKLRLETGQAVTLSLANRSGTGASIPKPGDLVEIGFAPEDAVVLTR